MTPFLIQDIRYSEFYGEHGTYIVTVQINVKDWTRLRNKGQLGALYGIDISNKVYQINRDIRAYNPTVSDRGRAVNGMKTITLEYWALKKPTKLTLVRGGK